MPDQIPYPELPPYNFGHLIVSESPYHKIYYEEYGSPGGEPVLFVHGGPGAAAGAESARFFDPERFRVVIWHQRGTGKSEPFLSLENNTTRHQVEDIVRLREHLGLEGKVHVFGGSWGSTLALVYAISYPQSVASLTLRGIFLGRGSDIHDAYQLNATRSFEHYAGPASMFPEAWGAFVDFIPPDERDHILEAYHRRIHSNGPDQLEASRQWTAWEINVLNLHPSSQDALEKTLAMTDEVLSGSIMETHYFKHSCFLSDFGGDNFILENADKLTGLPVTIVQGRYDQCTPRKMADELVNALNSAREGKGRPPVEYVLTVAGHSQADEDNQLELVHAINQIERLR